MRKLFFCSLILVILCGCRKETPIPPPPEEIIQNAIERMKESSGFHFLIEREGAPAFIDTAETLSIRRMEGDFLAPDRVQATIRIIAPGIVAEVDVIGIGDTQWETHPLSGAWEKLPPNWGFNPALFFDSETGLQSLLLEDLKEPVLLGTFELEDWPGTNLYQISGFLDAEHIHQISFGLIGNNTLDVNLWIDPENFEIYSIILTDGVAEEQRIWTVDIWDYDQILVIEPPLVDEAN